MTLFDTHTHFYLPEFAPDLAAGFERAAAAGVAYMALPNIDSETIEAVNKMRDSYPGKCFAMMGLHPGSVKQNFAAELERIKAELERGGYVAIGEIGMDLYWSREFIEEQKEVFKIQLQWAREKQLPIVIHARDSFEELFEILDRENDPSLSGVFHCFTGNARQTEKILDYGNFYLGIGGVVTFKNAGLDKILPEIGLQHLVLETDAPYLAPHPFRGKRNEPAYISYVCDKVATVFNTSPEEVASVTTANAKKLFQLSL